MLDLNLYLIKMPKRVFVAKPDIWIPVLDLLWDQNRIHRDPQSALKWLDVERPVAGGLYEWSIAEHLMRERGMLDHYPCSFSGRFQHYLFEGENFTSSPGLPFKLIRGDDSLVEIKQRGKVTEPNGEQYQKGHKIVSQDAVGRWRDLLKLRGYYVPNVFACGAMVNHILGNNGGIELEREGVVLGKVQFTMKKPLEYGSIETKVVILEREEQGREVYEFEGYCEQGEEIIGISRGVGVRKKVD